MSEWQPDHYLLFAEERSRPCRDLAAQISIDSPEAVIDLGCGPGNSTAVLAGLWPEARITGLDSSPEMLERARRAYPRHQWVRGDVAEWASRNGADYDVVFSNAVMHWIGGHASLYPRLLSRVARGGVLAIQVPANLDGGAHRLMKEIAASPPWRGLFPPGRVVEPFVHTWDFYYDVLSAGARTVNIWETTYMHVLPNAEAIGHWYKATGLRPFLDALPEPGLRDRFLRDFIEAARAVFKPRPDGSVIFPFKRLFLIAGKGG
jgi:trans-aconitate 2-methyltransferase